MQKLLLIPLDDTVIFPTMDINLPVDATGEERVLLVPRREGEYAKVGTIANVTGSIRLPGGARGASLESIARGVISGSAQSDGRLDAGTASEGSRGLPADSADAPTGLVPGDAAPRSDGGNASTSTFRPTDRAVAGLTVSAMTCCIRSTSVQSFSLPNVSNRKIALPSGD